MPRSSTELFPDQLKLSPKQREVLNALQAFPQGAKSAEVAQVLGMHVNTARGHLDELVLRKAVRVVTAPAKGRGRPSLIFQVRVPDSKSIAEEYVSLIGIMAEILADKDELEDWESVKAHTIGRNWAASIRAHGLAPSSPEEARDLLFRKLRDMGFDPVVRSQAGSAGGCIALDLNACPFVAAGIRPSPFLCAIHDGFLSHLVSDESGGRVKLDLHPMMGNGACRVALQTVA